MSHYSDIKLVTPKRHPDNRYMVIPFVHDSMSFLRPCSDLRSAGVNSHVSVYDATTSRLLRIEDDNGNTIEVFKI